MADEDTGAGTHEIDTLRAQLAAATAELTNAKARIGELNNEAKGHRLNGDNHRKAAEDAAKARDEAIAEAARIKAEIEAATAERIKEAEGKATEAMTKAQLRAINADLRIAAKDAGATDLADVLALLPRDKLKVNDDGDVENAAEIIAEFKKAKPHLFGAVNTSGTTQTPPPKSAAAKRPSEMTDEEFAAALKNKAWRK